MLQPYLKKKPQLSIYITKVSGICTICVSEFCQEINAFSSPKPLYFVQIALRSAGAFAGITFYCLAV